MGAVAAGRILGVRGQRFRLATLAVTEQPGAPSCQPASTALGWHSGSGTPEQDSGLGSFLGGAPLSKAALHALRWCAAPATGTIIRD